MIISEHWLREWISPELDTDGLVECLTMAGLEVDSVTRAGPALAKVVVGRILSLETHPDAAKLRLCQVDVGRRAPLGIVCGAANAHVGMRAPVALVGAELPGGTRIKKTTIRGHESTGMLCSAAELGLDDHADGLLALDRSAPIGDDISRYLTLDDAVIDIDLTPNRGDCLSIVGIARELAVLTGAPLLRREVPGSADDDRTRIDIKVDDPRACPRYVGRVLGAVDPRAATPDQMRERLRRCGIRPLSAIVDVTNYVMLELGQPMHAFDMRQIRNKIIVRRALADEAMEMLDGSVVKLDAQTLAIADLQGPIALAGVMGGARSGIQEDSADILLEAAHFTPSTVAGKARQYGIQTESSHRFERGVDPALPAIAAQYATALIKNIAGGRAGPLHERVAKPHLPHRREISLLRRNVDRLLGITVAKRDIGSVLKRVSGKVRSKGDRWQVTPPSFRFDLERECDLIEEIARVRGYDKIPTKAPSMATTARIDGEAKLPAGRLKQTLMIRDYREVVSYSFVDPELQSLFAASDEGLSLANPLAANLSEMRLSMWPGLIQIVRANLNRQHRRVRVFEVGHTFHRAGDTTREVNRIAGAISGSAREKQWAEVPRESDFFDVKGDVEALLALTGSHSAFTFRALRAKALHPGQSAEIRRDGRTVGCCGRLHPGLQAELDIDQAVYLFELEVDALTRGRLPAFASVSKFPVIRRDLSILVDQKVAANDLLDAIRGAAGEHLVEVNLFDVFRPEGVDRGRKSLAFTLTLQASSRTLRDEEVDSIVGDTVGALHQRFGAELRS